MKRFIFALSLVLLSMSAFAQNADSVTLATASRQKLRLGKASGYTLTATLFDAVQTISVIKFSPKYFTAEVIQPENHTEVSVVGEQMRAQFAINAGFWNRKLIPTTFVKSNGAVVSETFVSSVPRVNGVLFIYDHGIEIVESYDAPDYPTLADKFNSCNNILACGPLLIDNGKPKSYQHIHDSTDPLIKRHSPFFSRRHPRSAIGCDKEGNIYLIVVDGRAKGNAEGVSIEELTQLCSWLGLYDALNLDGGGSSALWSRKYGVVSHPCDNRKFDHDGERRVSSTIVVKAR